MKKYLAFLIIVASLSAGPVSKYGTLKTKGNKIVGESGEPVVLRGMSMFWSQWKGDYYNKFLVDWLVEDWNITVIRAAMGVDKEKEGYLAAPGREKRKVEAIIDAAVEKDIYVIVDWHDHHAEDNLEESIKFFGEMAKRFSGKKNIIYEIYNEPLKISWSVIREYASQVISEIRKYDEDNLIIVGSPYWDQRVDEAAKKPVRDHNTAYSLHFYAGSHKEDIRNRAQKALDMGIPLFVTEFGTTHYDGGSDGKVHLESSQIWIDWLEERHISWVNWSVTDKEEASAIILPESSTYGEWQLDELTPSGQWIREKLRSFDRVNTPKEEAEEESTGWFKALKKKK